MATLYDQFGRPIDLSALREEQATANLTGVRQTVSPDPSSNLTPGRLAQLLLAAEMDSPADYLALAERMEEKDWHYRSVLGTRKRQVSQLEVTVTPASDDKNDIANSEIIQDFVDRNILQTELFDLLDAVGKGFAVGEIKWDMSERDWRPVSIDWVDPRWIVFDTPDRRTPRLLSDTGQGEDLAAFKFVRHFSSGKSGLPIRAGLARPAAWAYLFKNFDLKGWVEFAEIYGQPLRVGKFGPGATEEEKKTLLRAVANIGRDAAAIIPQSMLLEFVEAGGGAGTKGADVYEKLAKYLDQSLSKLVLGQTATTDAIAGGHAVGQEHNDVRGDIERADANELEATLQRDVIKPLIDLNRGPQKRYPKISIGRAEETDIAGLSDALAKLVPLGLRVSETEIRGKMGLKEPENDLDVLGARRPAPDTPPSKSRMPDPTLPREDLSQDHTAHHSQGDEHDLADRLTTLVESAAAPALTELIDQVKLQMEDASDLHDLASRILTVYPDLDMTALAAAMRDGMLAADLAGRAEIDALVGSLAEGM